MRKPGRVGWAWIYAVSLAFVLSGAGSWAGYVIGAGIGAAIGAAIGAVAGGFTPLLIDQAKRKQDATEEAARAAAEAARAAAEAARDAEELPRRYGPAHLLEPGLGVVPFFGRLEELAALEAWCDAPEGRLVRLMTGGGGTGKTRLALKLCARMEGRGWRCVTVGERAEADVIRRERLAAPGVRLLLVVDYAEARIGLAELLKSAIRDEGDVRVLLLARHAGDWWQRLGAAAGAVRDVVAEANQALMPLAGDVAPGLAAEGVVRGAVPYFAVRLGVQAPAVMRVVVSAEADPRVLDLHAAALVAVIQSMTAPGRPVLEVDVRTVLETLLGHERHYWLGRAQAAGLGGGRDGRDGLSIAQLSHLVAAGCLLGAATVAALAGRVPGLTVTEAVALWLRELYPPDSDGMLGVLRPDRLAELHVSRELGGSRGLADACLTGLDAAQARRALVLLARASADHESAQVLLESSLARFPDVVEGIMAPREVMVVIADAIPYPSVALAGAHASISRQVLATYLPGTEGRAQWLNNLAVLLGDLGRREEALAAIEQAVAIYRELAEARPDTYLPDLARSLSNQSVSMSELGRREEALAAISQAVDIRRELAEARPDAFLPDFAASLSNQSVCLSELGRREEALAAIDQAVAIFRELAEARPDAFLPDFAASLSNQSVCLSELGRREEALAAIDQAVAIFRELAEARPDTFLPDFARSLNNESNRLSELGCREEALAAIDQAVAIRRELAEARPDTFLPDLATSLNNQSERLVDLGRLEDALAAIDQAVIIRRALAATSAAPR